MKEIREGKIKTIVFDMDGTIYQLDGENNGFKKSSLHKNVKQNTLRYFAEKEGVSPEEAQSIVDDINKLGVFPSVYAANKYKITRKDFFDNVWNIDPQAIVTNYQNAVEVITKLAEQNIELILLTQAPKIWQTNVLTFLNINNLFSTIRTGEEYMEKIEILTEISKTRQPHTVLAVGDQIETDIAPAKELGFHTFHVNSPNDLLQLVQNEQ